MPALTRLELAMDRDEWLPVDGVVDQVITRGDFILNDGTKKHGAHVEIQLEHVKFDDGQAALDAALARSGTMVARIPGPVRTLLGELKPYAVDPGEGKRYTVRAALLNATWGPKC